ncbi:MAG: hypothetical protein WA188_17615 [Terriglobales bacterium]
MSSEPEIAARYVHAGVLVDSNILLLLFIGSYDLSLVGRFKRIAAFARTDYELLLSTLSRFSAVVTTPMILTEVNSLSNLLESRHKYGYYTVFSLLVDKMLEEVPTTKEIVATEFFKKFGYTDAAIAIAARQRYLVLTDDFALSGFLQSQQIDVINFNHLRQAAGAL